MELVIFNASLYIIVLLVYYFKTRKAMDFGFFLLAIYATTAVTCVFHYAATPEQWDLTLWPFIFMFVVVHMGWF